jgi:hypothetical protein
MTHNDKPEVEPSQPEVELGDLDALGGAVGGSETTSGAESPPSSVSLNLGGVAISAALPGTTQKAVTVSISGGG